MKIVIPGGTGQVGGVLARALRARGDEVVVVSRGGSVDGRTVKWDGRSVGPWAQELDGADVVINLAGRSVNCRYTAANLAAMMSSRVDSTRAVGLAIEKAERPPRVWLQMSTATIYAHRFDAPNDELTGRIGGDEPDVPATWKLSIDIRDFARAVEFLIERDDIDGPVNLAAPNPVPQRDFMAGLRTATGARLGLPATKWMAEIGAFFLRTDTELTAKSRRVVPARLVEAGFAFDFPKWPDAARDLVERRRAKKVPG